MKIREKSKYYLINLACLIVVALFASIPVCIFWNLIMPLFGIAKVKFWQMVLGMIMCDLLTGMMLRLIDNIKKRFCFNQSNFWNNFK